MWFGSRLGRLLLKSWRHGWITVPTPGNPRRGNPQLPKPRGPPAGAKLTGKAQTQQGLEEEPELRAIRASSKKREIPISPGRTLDAQSTKACTCTYMLGTGTDDGGKVSLFSELVPSSPSRRAVSKKPSACDLCVYLSLLIHHFQLVGFSFSWETSRRVCILQRHQESSTESSCVNWL